MIYVIGSGPAGVSVATALLARGCSVTMLDVGVSLEEEKQALITAIQSTWDNDLIQKTKHPLNTKNPIKLSYNSNYPYAEVNNHFSFNMDKNVHLMPSLAKGGLSNVWGAFVETYSANDLADWPIQLSQLEPYYKKVLTSINCTENRNFFQLSQQANHLYSHFDSYKNKLNSQGIEFHKATLATQFTECKYCGNCQHGCPLDLIYSARHTLNDLLKHPKFCYISNIIVEDIKETDKKVTIYAKDKKNNMKIMFEAQQVFSACGPIISTLLALKAMNAYDHEIKFIDSTHFMIPCLMRHRIKNIEREKLHTLCQLYLKIKNKSLLERPINLQIYTYMDHYTEKFKQLGKIAYPIISPLLKPLIDRMIIIQGHLHSDNSHQFSMRLGKDNNTIMFKSNINAQVRKNIKQLTSHLKENKKYLDFSCIKLMTQISKIGKSFHYGGSMPMKLNPTSFETSIFGVLAGHKRWHIVDASIFPSIPAGSITPTIMANAYRIGMECTIYE